MPVLGGFPPTSPILTYPGYNATGIPTSFTFTWDESDLDCTFNINVLDGSNVIRSDSNVGLMAWAVSGLAYNHTYTWKVQALNSNGNSDWVQGTFTTGQAPIPNTPTDVSIAYPTSQTKPVFSWADSNNAEYYHLKITNNMSQIIKETDVTGLSYAIATDLYYNQGYNIHLSAINSSGSSTVYTEGFSIVDAPTPAVPTITSPSSGQTNVDIGATFTWTGSEPLYEWQITSDSTYTNIVQSGTGSGKSATLTPSLYDFNTTYYFRVRAKHLYNDSTYTKYSSWVNKSFSTMSAPSISPHANTDTGNNISVDWDKYTSFISSVTVNYTRVTDSVTGTSGSLAGATGAYYFSGLYYSEEYDFSFVVTYINGNTSTQAAPSTATTDAPPALSAPTNLVPADAATGISETPVFSWGSVTAADGYEIDIDDSSDFASVLQSSSPSSATYTYSGNLAWGTAYYVRVRATKLYNDGKLVQRSSYATHGFTVKIIPIPATPGDIIITYPTATKPVFSWSAIEYAEKYHIVIEKI